MGILTGKTALVTGTSRASGIGAAVAYALAEAGANIFLSHWRAYDATMPWGSDPQDLTALIKSVEALPARCAVMEADLAQLDAPKRLFDAACAEFHHVDILVNNAAMSIEQDLYTLTPEALDAAHGVNVRGTMLLTAEFARRHDGRPGGRVINMTSGQGDHPMPAELPYVASKGAIDAFTRSASVTLARKQITINAIEPGATDTGWMAPELAESLRQSHPRQRVGTPTDVANLVVFLASDGGGWISGQVLKSRGAA